MGESRTFVPRPELLEADLDLAGPIGPLDHGGLVVALAVVNALEDLHGVPNLHLGRHGRCGRLVRGVGESGGFAAPPKRRPQREGG